MLARLSSRQGCRIRSVEAARGADVLPGVHRFRVASVQSALQNAAGDFTALPICDLLAHASWKPGTAPVFRMVRARVRILFGAGGGDEEQPKDWMVNLDHASVLESP
jgi:hypothetical protein